MAKSKKNHGNEDEIEISYKSIAGKYSKKKPATGGKKSKLAIILISVFLLIVLIGLAFVAYKTGLFGYNGKVEVKTVMVGVDITGMSYEDAVESVKKATASTYSKNDMTVKLGEHSVILKPETTGITVNFEDAVKAACEANASNGSFFNLKPFITINEEATKKELSALIETVSQTMVPTSYAVEGEVGDLSAEDAPADGLKFIVTVGQPGVNVSLESLYDKVLDAYSQNIFNVEHSAEYAEPTVPDFDEIKMQHSQDPIDAVMDKTTFEVSTHAYGYSIDTEEILAALENAQYGQVLEFKFKYIEPEEKKSELEGMLFRDVLGEYTATNPSIPGGRDVNLKLSCEKINNIVLMPGETFDYNKTLGERTAAAGWKKADGYMGMETVSEYGGGICQASSSLYYCALIADLEIVTRHCHGFISAYMPPGMDATVSWGGPHFRFKNNMEYPIRIEAEAKGGTVTVRLLGTDTKDYYVEMEYEQYNMIWWKTEYVEMTTEQANAKGYKDGSVICTPYNGSTVQTYKLKYDKDTKELISREKEELSIYNCRNYMICKIVDPVNPDDGNTGTDTPTEPTDPTDPTEPTETPTPSDPPLPSGDDHEGGSGTDD